MVCERCKAQLDDSARFCSNCGNTVGAAPFRPRNGRVAGHIRLLGILWIALSAFRLIPSLVLIAISGWFVSGWQVFPPEIAAFVPALLGGLGVLFLLFGAVGVAAGWGLLARQPWARMLAIVFGAVNLIDIPFGTAIGIYTLWVLLPTESEQEYRSAVRVA